MKISVYVFLFIFLLNSCENKAQQNGGGSQLAVIGLDEFKSKLMKGDEVQFLDVRTPEEWARGVVGNPIKINFYDPDFAQRIKKEVSKEKPVVVYCQAGVRSVEAAKILKELGYPVIYEFRGGYASWLNGRN
jgi:rhodanese-related sulfurtransferase